MDSYKIISFTFLLTVGLLFAGCGIFDSDDSNPLESDLSFEMEGEPGTTAFLAVSHSQGMEFSGQTIGSREIPESGVFSEALEGGDFDAYQVSATPSNPDAEFTLRLISDGDVLDVADEPEEEGFYVVQYGEFPDFGLE